MHGPAIRKLVGVAVGIATALHHPEMMSSTLPPNNPSLDKTDEPDTIFLGDVENAPAAPFEEGESFSPRLVRELWDEIPGVLVARDAPRVEAALLASPQMNRRLWRAAMAGPGNPMSTAVISCSCSGSDSCSASCSACGACNACGSCTCSCSSCAPV